jgi:hypothetical protein
MDQQRHKLPFKVGRKLLMEYSRIASISTYHICIKDLIEFQFIKYAPSYNSYEGTLVSLLIKNECCFLFRQEINSDEAKSIDSSVISIDQVSTSEIINHSANCIQFCAFTEGFNDRHY